MFPKALTFGRASYRKRTAPIGVRTLLKSEGENVDHKDDKTATTLKCPHCGQERQIQISAERMGVPFTVICRQCRKKFKPVVLSNVKSKKPPKSRSRKSAIKSNKLRQLWQDPVLRWALILPIAILIPFFCYLMWQLNLAQWRKKIVYLGLEARSLAADNQNRDAYGKYSEVLEIAGNSDPGTEETRRFVETAKTESERLLPLVRGQLEGEKLHSQVQFRGKYRIA